MKSAISCSPQNVLKSPATMTGLVRALHQLEEVPQLRLPMAELEREVHEEHAKVVEFEFDDQSLDAGVEIVEALAFDARRREERVRLLVHDRHERVERVGAVLALVAGKMTERFGDDVRLVDAAAADRAGVDLDQADDVRVLRLDEAGDARQHPGVAAQVAGARDREVKRSAGAGGVADVVKQKAH